MIERSRPPSFSPAVRTSEVETRRALLSGCQDQLRRTGTDGVHRSPIPIVNQCSDGVDVSASDNRTQ
jgi:hypothetical protein